MKLVVQRVLKAGVRVDQKLVSEIGPGLLTLIGIAPTDSPVLVQKAIDKVLNLRIFEDKSGKMNLSLKDIQGAHLIVSQFTLLGDAQKGNRPSFIAAARPEVAKPLYEEALRYSASQGVPSLGGLFGADMKVELINDGPVTIVLDF